MNTKTTPIQIGMRELVRNTKKIKEAVARGEEFHVFDHALPVFKVSAIPPKKVIKYTFEDLMNFRVKTDRTDLSMNVDKIVYGDI
jgi:antitoxin (DNA-binding transcriptional repressor) of toxin-antitoxin stability system